MPTISLLKADSFTESFYKEYSFLKHGSKRSARLFGKQVAEIVTFNENSNLLVFSAPHSNIATASNAFKDYLLANCTRQFLQKNISVKQSKIDRLYSYDDDYGKMSKVDREKAISSDIFHIDKNFIQPNDILIFVDDIKITGAHEKRILELLDRENITNETIFIYIAEYTGNEPSIEHKLNHHSVNSLLDVNYIIRNDEFIFNTRIVKYILAANSTEFINFITYQSSIFNETLFNLAFLNGYNKNAKYSVNFETLNKYLTK